MEILKELIQKRILIIIFDDAYQVKPPETL